MTVEISCDCGDKDCMQKFRISEIDSGTRFEVWHKSQYGEESLMYVSKEDVSKLRRYLHQTYTFWQRMRLLLDAW